VVFPKVRSGSFFLQFKKKEHSNKPTIQQKLVIERGKKIKKTDVKSLDGANKVGPKYFRGKGGGSFAKTGGSGECFCCEIATWGLRVGPQEV